LTKTVDTSASVDLIAVLVALTGEMPVVLTIENGKALPSGPLESGHRTLQTALRSWVERQTHHPLGYIEQLYTFADRDRVYEGGSRRVISISYLGLVRQGPPSGDQVPGWQSWYRYLPWEDWREGVPSLIAQGIMPRLGEWVAQCSDSRIRRVRAQRVHTTFSRDARAWNEELVLQRYELLYEAGLVAEACPGRSKLEHKLFGDPMALDHRRILATGIARLRAKIKYRPVLFELMPLSFTLLQLQRTLEALAGRRLHKQNFRRLVQEQGLVEPTGDVASGAAGRPAQLFRFQHKVLRERAVSGTKLPLSHAI
jgi:hypothetical protein